VPSISIIVPARNEATTIVDALTELQSWRQLGHEVIVVDGQSTDNTVKLAYPLCDTLIRSHPGRALQMNVGANAASGDLFLFLHADSILPTTALTELSELANGSHNVWGRFDVRFDTTSFPYKCIATLMNWRSRITGVATGDQAIFISRTLFNDGGGFPNIALMEDIAMSTQLRGDQDPICLRSKVTTSARRWQTQGLVRTIVTMWCLRLAFFFGVSPVRLREIYDRQ
jgi:rSAM/selenodomain-associated transferase 2